MAVAAAIGVGEEAEDVMSNRLANATNRLSGKRSLLRSGGMSNGSSGVSQQQQQQQQGLSEINRSIEKMTLQPMNNGESSSAGSSSKSSGTGCKTSRRDSDWTSVSTEDPGYGSMRSDQVNGSRRCSELSTASQVQFSPSSFVLSPNSVSKWKFGY